MLVLTRKPGEAIIIGNNRRVEVLSVSRGVVKFCLSVEKPVVLMPGHVQIDLQTHDGQTYPITVTRKVDDSIVIDSDPEQQVEVLVVAVKGESVRVGVKAPRSVQVHREEVFELIHSEHNAARAGASDPGNNGHPGNSENNKQHN
jgi:carbon storage regulator